MPTAWFQNSVDLVKGADRVKEILERSNTDDTPIG